MLSFKLMFVSTFWGDAEAESCRNFCPQLQEMGEMLAPFCIDAFLKHFFVLDSPFSWVQFASLAALVASFSGGEFIVGARGVLKNHFDDLWRFRKNLP